MNHAMLMILGLLLFLIPLFSSPAFGQSFETDVIETSAGPLKISFIGHGTLMFAFAGKIIHVDPYSRLSDYSKLPKADIVLITHEHQDHLDTKALTPIRTEKTAVIANDTAAKQLEGAAIMKNGETKNVQGIKIEAVPAYNLVHKRQSGEPFHPKGSGNGYVLTFGDKRVYVAGDTENVPEMAALKGIDVAFLPMNLPYTMTPEMVAEAVKSFRPKILYPYHFGDTDTAVIQKLLKDEKGIEVRIRSMK